MVPKPKTGKKRIAAWTAKQRRAKATLAGLKKRPKEGKASFAKRTARAKSYASSTGTPRG